MSGRQELLGLLERPNLLDATRRLYEADLAGPPCPAELLDLHDVFERLSRRRPNNGFGPGAITYEQVKAFRDLFDIPLSPWEVEIIERLDNVWAAGMAGKWEPLG